MNITKERLSVICESIEDLRLRVTKLESFKAQDEEACERLRKGLIGLEKSFEDARKVLPLITEE